MFNPVEYKATAASSAKFTHELLPGRQYYIKGDGDFFFKVGPTSVTAAANTNGNTHATAGVLYPLCNLEDTSPTTDNGFVAIIDGPVTAVDVNLYVEDYGSAR